MKFGKEILKYYKKNYLYCLFSCGLGIFFISFYVLPMVAIYMATENIILAHIVGSIIWILITTSPFFIANSKFISQLSEENYEIRENKKKYYIISQIITMIPALIILLIVGLRLVFSPGEL